MMVRLADAVTPEIVPEMVAEVVELTFCVLTANDAVVLPAAMVTV